VFNHHQPLTAAQPFLNKLWNFSGLFFSLSAISIFIGQIERKHRMKKHNIENNKLKIQEIQS
jgi:hypothetical protein